MSKLIICPSDYKKAYLKKLHDDKQIENVNFMSLKEYETNYFFDYDTKAIKHLMDKFNLSVSNTKKILNNLKYVNDTT